MARSGGRRDDSSVFPIVIIAAVMVAIVAIPTYVFGRLALKRYGGGGPITHEINALLIMAALGVGVFALPTVFEFLMRRLEPKQEVHVQGSSKLQDRLTDMSAVEPASGSCSARKHRSAVCR